MIGQFATYALLVAMFLPFIGIWVWRRTRHTGTLVMREEYDFLPDGRLRASTALFDPATQIATLKNPDGSTQDIPFTRIVGVRIYVRTSRKIHIGLLLEGQVDPQPLSIVSNHDLKLAGINVHRLVETLTGEGDAFLDAYRNHQWSRILIDSEFIFDLRSDSVVALE